jgi:hypothetical protein
MSVLSYLDRILTELRQLLELGTVTTIILRAATLKFSHSENDQLLRRRLRRFRRRNMDRLRWGRG